MYSSIYTFFFLFPGSCRPLAPSLARADGRPPLLRTALTLPRTPLTHLLFSLPHLSLHPRPSLLTPPSSRTAG